MAIMLGNLTLQQSQDRSGFVIYWGLKLKEVL